MAIRVLLLVLLVALQGLQRACQADENCQNACSNVADLKRRIGAAVDSETGSWTEVGRGLHGSLENVFSAEECDWIVNRLPPQAFVVGGGYEDQASPTDFAGLSLPQLVEILEEEEYAYFLDLRERLRARTETALGVCAGTLHVHFTHIAQKTIGGVHASHADNCYHSFSTHPDGSAIVPICNETKPHPYYNRMATSILYLNDDTFEGGEFYWANLSNAEPLVVVAPQAGRMNFFTAGPENLHGALPVLKPTQVDTTQFVRRLAYTLWYTVDDKVERIPKWGQHRSDKENTEPDPDAKRLFALPLYSIQRDSVRNILGQNLIAQTDSKLWQTSQAEDGNAIYVLFHDHTAMVEIHFYKSLIAVDRHMGETGASLQYMLQESLLLHVLLDKLEAISLTGESSASSLSVKERDESFRKARGALAARRA